MELRDLITNMHTSYHRISGIADPAQHSKDMASQSTPSVMSCMALSDRRLVLVVGPVPL